MLRAFSFTSLLFSASDAMQPKLKTIYGEDNRRDLYNTTNDFIAAVADSTVLLVLSEDLILSGRTYSMKTMTLQERKNLCPEEKFSDQPTGGFCSGTLISGDSILTAGHCVTTQAECDSIQIVFGFSIYEEGQYVTTFDSDEVYSCKTLQASVDSISDGDYAIFTLDRSVLTHAPAKLANRTQSDPLPTDSPLVLIGHPTYLPTKIADDGVVCDEEEAYYHVTSDAFAGNSGSGLFHPLTGEVEGILSFGDDDYQLDVSRRCATVVTYTDPHPCEEGLYAGVTKIAKVSVPAV